MVFDSRAEIERIDTMIHTIEKWQYLLTDACQCQQVPDRNEDKLLILRACRVLIPAGAGQCQIWPTHSIVNEPDFIFIINVLFAGVSGNTMQNTMFRNFLNCVHFFHKSVSTQCLIRTLLHEDTQVDDVGQACV